MAWDIERRGRRSMLIGAAHFFPRHFRRDLRRLIGPARVVLLEGPLDEAATKKVIEAGQGTGGERLYHAAKEAVRARLGIVPLPLDVHQILKDLVFGRQEEWLEAELRKLKPWAAFFGIWTRWRAREGWEHKMDLDAAAIAAKLGKPVRHLETIEEQIGALEAVPFERYVRFLASADWSGYNESYERHYLAGDVEGLAAAAQDFPTYCEPVIARRDPVLASRMLGELARGDACVVLGVAHCRGVLAAIKAEGYAVRQLSSGCS
ncbi:MAG TPA: TraB/GumN family protein [Burkholderiales bacterium]|nr:TraB/GumN family protein [Burkholderiales bacterium]